MFPLSFWSRWNREGRMSVWVSRTLLVGDNLVIFVCLQFLCGLLLFNSFRLIRKPDPPSLYNTVCTFWFLFLCDTWNTSQLRREQTSLFCFFYTYAQNSLSSCCSLSLSKHSSSACRLLNLRLEGGSITKICDKNEDQFTRLEIPTFLLHVLPSILTTNFSLFIQI